MGRFRCLTLCGSQGNFHSLLLIKALASNRDRRMQNTLGHLKKMLDFDMFNRVPKIRDRPLRIFDCRDVISMRCGRWNKLEKDPRRDY